MHHPPWTLATFVPLKFRYTGIRGGGTLTKEHWGNHAKVRIWITMILWICVVLYRSPKRHKTHVLYTVMVTGVSDACSIASYRRQAVTIISITLRWTISQGPSLPTSLVCAVVIHALRAFEIIQRQLLITCYNYFYMCSSCILTAFLLKIILYRILWMNPFCLEFQNGDSDY